MSIQLYKTDYMSVVWEYTKKTVLVWAEAKEEVQEYINLFFTIQVNGKIKTSQHYFKLMRWEDKTEDYSGLTLERFEGWYAIRNLLTNIGYPMWWINEPDSNDFNIVNWIDKAYSAYEETDTFHF